MRALPSDCPRTRCSISILFTLVFSTVTAEPLALPQWFLQDIKAHTADGGRWVADNSAYRSEDEPFDAYVIEWKSGFDGTTMTGRLFGLDDGEETSAFWEFRQYWHPGRKEAVIKGTAHYYSLNIADKQLGDAAWTYEEPYEEHAALKDRIAFYDERGHEVDVKPRI